MISTNSFEIKLQSIEKRIIKAQQGIRYLQELIHKLKKLAKINEVKQVFIRKDLELKQTKILLAEYISQLSIYNKHKAAICGKSKSLQIAIGLLNDISDKVTNLITTVQSMIIFLEYSEYK